MTPSERPVLVKLGGSVLTRKDELRSLRPEALQRLAGELARVDRPLVLLHGAGSFGHVLAEKHRLHEGHRDPAQLQGLAEVRADLHDLHLHVLRTLHAEDLPAVGLPPFGHVELHDGRLEDLDPAPFQRSLDAGLLPVTHGDVLLDQARGFGIVSGDALAEHLARGLRPALAVFATDVAGILQDGDPLPHLTPDELTTLTVGGSRHPDVTGGMAGKAHHMARIARAGVPVRVLDGTTPGRLAGALTGDPVTGTLIAEGGPPVGT